MCCQTAAMSNMYLDVVRGKMWMVSVLVVHSQRDFLTGNEAHSLQACDFLPLSVET